MSGKRIDVTSEKDAFSCYSAVVETPVEPGHVTRVHPIAFEVISTNRSGDARHATIDAFVHLYTINDEWRGKNVHSGL